MDEQNLNNVIVIDRNSKKVLNEPKIEIDEFKKYFSTRYYKSDFNIS